jgi:hypothetical protein
MHRRAIIAAVLFARYWPALLYRVCARDARVAYRVCARGARPA